MQLGKGGEARVYGPFSYSQLSSVLSQETLKPLDSKKKFIVKVFVSEKSWSPSHNQTLNKMKQIPFPEVVVFPIVSITIPKENLKPLVPSPIQSESNLVDIQIQEYGGKDVFDYFFKESSHSLSVRNLIHIWDCFQKMLVNCYYWIVKMGLVITDIKMENMVFLKSKERMEIRFIDLSFSRPDSRSRTITYQLDLLPIQYFTPMFTPVSKTWEKKVSKFKQKGEKKYQIGSDGPEWKKILHQIHQNRSSFQDVFAYYTSQPIHPVDSPFFLVVYPLFITILQLIVYRVKIKNKKEEQLIRQIRDFCIEILRRRGKIFSASSPKLMEKEMESFLKEMNLCSVLVK